MVKTTNNYLGTTRDGYKVYDRADSHIHLENGITKRLVEKALNCMYANGAIFKKKAVRFHNYIGYSNCVMLTSQDEVIMVYRKGREGKTPMVKGRNPEPCKTLTVVIRKEKNYENHYTLITCFVGEESMREPWDKGIKSDEERKECEKYWSTHALVYNSELIDWERMKSS